jgi:hypothetical protein
VGPRELALIVDPEGDNLARSYVAARPPVDCP